MQPWMRRPDAHCCRIIIGVVLTVICLEWIPYVRTRLALYLRIGSPMECGFDGINSFECRNCDCQAFPEIMFLPSKCIMPEDHIARDLPSLQASPPALISIVIVCHNHNQERYLIGAMNSVWAATSRLPANAHESFLVDDASSCFTRRVRVHASHLGMYVHRNEDNMGLASTRNYVAAYLAKGNHLLFLGAEDLLHPAWLASAWGHLANTDLVYGNQILFNEAIREEWETNPNVAVADVVRANPFPITNLIRRSSFLRHGGFSTSMLYGGEDHAFWTTLVRFNASRVHVNVISSYHRTTNEFSASNRRGAKALLALSHPSLFNNQRVCKALRAVRAMAHNEAMIERTLRSSTNGDCPGWVILALHKRRARCEAELPQLWNEALDVCQRAIQRGHASNDTLLLLNYVRHATDFSQCKSQLYAHSQWSKERAPPYRWYTAPQAQEAIECPRTLSRPMPLARPKAPPAVSKVIHFIYALMPDAPFDMMHRMAILSAVRAYPGFRINFHCSYVPQGEHWEAIESSVHLVLVDPQSNVYAGRCLQHHAHKADYLRLRALHDHGGIYFDMDTITLRPLPKEYLNEGRFLIGAQDTVCWQKQGGKVKVVPCVGRHYGLCNAVMASPPGNAFVAEWLRRYESFASTGLGDSWDYHSVRLPGQLARCPSLSAHIRTLDADAFFPFYWGRAKSVLFTAARSPQPSLRVGSRVDLFRWLRKEPPEINLSKSYTIHLWTSGNDKNYSRLFSSLSVENICTLKHAYLYARLACSILRERERR